MEYHFSARRAASRGTSILMLLVAIGLLTATSLDYFFSSRYVRIQSEVRKIESAPGETIEIPLTITVLGRTPPDLYGPYPIRGQIFPSNAESDVVELSPFAVLDLRDPHQRMVTASVIMPTKRGRYRLMVDLVDEGQFWFRQIGNRPLVLDVMVARDE